MSDEALRKKVRLLKATEAIDMILHDMDESGVITSKEGKHYEEILEGMNADNWWS